MNKKNIIISIIVAVALLSGAIYYLTKPNYTYTVKDYFSETTAQGKIVFMFVEVDTENLDFMEETGIYLTNNHPIMKESNDTTLTVLFAHMYQLKDTVSIPKGAIKELKKKYPFRKGLITRLHFINNAYVYSGFSRQVDDFDFPQDTLFQTPVFIPKSGVKAKDVLKSQPKKDTVKVDTTQIKKIDSLKYMESKK